jgi:hypothetical protein
MVMTEQKPVLRNAENLLALSQGDSHLDETRAGGLAFERQEK